MAVSLNGQLNFEDKSDWADNFNKYSSQNLYDKDKFGRNDLVKKITQTSNVIFILKPLTFLRSTFKSKIMQAAY